VASNEPQAHDACRRGTVQEIAETPEGALNRAIEIANKVAACGPLGIKTSLASAHLAIDAAEEEALSELDEQFGARYQRFHRGAPGRGRRPQACLSRRLKGGGEGPKPERVVVPRHRSHPCRFRTCFRAGRRWIYSGMAVAPQRDFVSGATRSHGVDCPHIKADQRLIPWLPFR